MGDFQRDYLSQTVFPCKLETMDGRPMGESMGMTMRDYFAGQALMGMQPLAWETSWAENAAKAAYQYADAMLEARKK